MKKCLITCLLLLVAAGAYAQDSLRMMTYNVHRGIGLDKECDLKRIADVISQAQPDVVAIQEVDKITVRHFYNQLGRLGTRTGMHATYGRAISLGLGSYGIGVLSREAPLRVERVSLPGSEEKRAMLLVEFEDYIYCCTHLSLTQADRLRSLDIIRDYAAKSEKPFFLAGDFNARPDSEFMSALSEDFIVLNDIDDYTFPAGNPDRTIDYIVSWKPTHGRAEVVNSEVLEEGMASDHRPVVVTLHRPVSAAATLMGDSCRHAEVSGEVSWACGTEVSAHEHRQGYAQETPSKSSMAYRVESFNFFDNREVHSTYQTSQTLFGSRLAAEVGLQFDANKIMLGVVGVKDFGQEGLAMKDVAFYYSYEEGHFSGAFGSFPRSFLKRELPDIFVYDSVRYYSPMLHGALLQYTSRHGYAEFYCNWINKQGVGEREVFEIVTDGRFGRKGYYLGWNVQLHHFSVPRPADGLKVYDKLMMNPHVGFEKSGMAYLDALAIEAGLMLSLNRDRQDMVWKSPMGFLGEVKLRKWRFELCDRIYAGNPQFSDYEKYGQALHRGDPYYRSSLYNRTDVRFYLLNRPIVQCYVGASFHYTEGSLDNSQLVMLRFTPHF